MTHTRKFTEEEVKNIIRGVDNSAETINQEILDQNRWSISMETLVKIDNKFYKLNWDSAATEYQEDFYWEQEAEELENVTEMIITSKYVPVGTQSEFKKDVKNRINSDLRSRSDDYNRDNTKFTDEELATAIKVLKNVNSYDIVPELGLLRQAGLIFLETLKENS